jgi:NADPH:quinone reductase-like Zn-dependent oxidoreductase
MDLPSIQNILLMKAVQISHYGDNSAIEVQDTPEPDLQKDQVMIKIKAAAVNPVDGAIRSGMLAGKVPLDFPVTLGGDFSGIITNVGSKVHDLKIGDEVYGQASLLNGGSGSFAEYAVADSSHVFKKPHSLNHNKAAALPLSGVSAIQALEENIKLKPGDKILIHGGAGGIGSFAVQLAKHLGAYVAATCSAGDIEYVAKLGADDVVDYHKLDFENLFEDYDAVLDTVGGDTYRKSFKILKKGGIIVSMLEQPGEDLKSAYDVKAIYQQTEVTSEKLKRLDELVDAGVIKVHIDKEFTLDKTQDAFEHKEHNHPRGKVVVVVS